MQFEPSNFIDHAEPGVEIVTDLSEVKEWANRLSQECQREWLQLIPGDAVPTIPQEKLASMKPRPTLYLSRLAYDKKSLKRPYVRAGVEYARSCGAEILIHPDLVNRMVLVDRRIALVPVTPGTDCPVLIITAPSLIAALLAQFNRVVFDASPLNGCPWTLHNAPEDFTEQDKSIVSLVIATHKMDVISRKLNIPVRTLGRRLQELRERVGADNNNDLRMRAIENWL